MAFLPRSSWTSTSNRAVSIKRSQVHVTWHYPGWGTNSIRTAGWSRARCFQQLRAWRNMHVGSGAYREVAYNYYALPTGDFTEGRGNRQNGANGKSTANRAGLSIQVLIGDNEQVTAGHARAMFDALAHVERLHPGIARRQYGHSHWVSTRCPGPHVRAKTPVSTSGTAPSPGVSKPVPSRPAAPSGKLVVDGRWGRATTTALQEFLNAGTPRRGGSKITVDGRMGPESWTALQRYLSAPYKDGKISRQSYRHTELGNGISPNGWEYTGRRSAGSQTIVLLQKWIRAGSDGIVGSGTSSALQRKLNEH